MPAQHFFGEADQVIHAACDLHRGYRGDNRHDDFDNVKGDCARFDLKKERQHQDAQPPGEANADPAKSCP